MHTPGPWKIGNRTDGYATSVVSATEKRFHPPAGREVNLHIASMGARDKHSYAEADANARLIAAAPDMLAALQQAFDTFQSMAREGIDMNTFNSGGIGFEAVKSIAAAIAKATDAA